MQLDNILQLLCIEMSQVKKTRMKTKIRTVIMIKDGTMEQRKKISAVLQDNRRSGLQRAEDVDGDELHALR